MVESKNVRSSRTSLDDETRNKIIELIAAQVSPAKISRQVGISEKSALRFARFKDIHGLDELRRLPSLTQELNLSPRKLASIVEFAIAYNMPQYMLELIFKTRSALLGDCIEIRKIIGHALMDNPKVAKLPESVNLEYLEEYVKAHNDGKSMQELYDVYCAHLEQSEANASYLNIKDSQEFRHYTRASKSDIAKLVLKYRAEGFSNAKIASLIGHTAHTVARYLNFIDIHGVDEAMRCPNLVDPEPLSKYDRSCIVEFMIAYNYPIDAAAVLFKADKKQLDVTYRQRLEAKVPLNGAIIARIPDSANMHLVNNNILKYNPDLSLSELKERYEQELHEARTNTEAMALRDMLSGKQDHELKLSIRKQQEAHLQASVNSAKSKLELVSKLQSMHQQHEISNLPTSDHQPSDLPTGEHPLSDLPTGDSPLSDCPTGEHSLCEQPTSDHPVSEQPTSDHGDAAACAHTQINADFKDAPNTELVSLLELITSLNEGMAVSDYLSNNDKSVGRPPKLNVFDQDFKSLPEKVQLLNYSRFVEDMRSLMEGAKARIELESKLGAMDAYTKECTHLAMRLDTYKSLIDKQPKLKRTLVQRALGLSQDKINYYTRLNQDKHMTRSERTQLISQYIVQLYQEHNGQLNLKSIIELLKSRYQVGISLNKLKTILQALDLRLIEADDHPDRL